MRVAHANWPHTVLKSKWEIFKVRDESYGCIPVRIISKKTGHMIIEVGCDATSEKLQALQREIAEHIVELHNSQLGK